MKSSNNVAEFAGLALVSLVLSVPGQAFAQAYPRKPIVVVLTQAPGPIDTTVRLMQPHVLEDLGQPVVVEYRPGASGFIGAGQVARAAPDGYTLLAISNSTIVTAAVLSKNVPFDPVKDFTPITMFSEPVNVVAVRASLPAASVGELIDYAKRNPGKLSYGSSGVGSVQNLDAEVIKQAAGLAVDDIVHVPYKGLGQVMQALMTGEIDVAFITFATIQSAVGPGKLRVLSNYSGRPHPSVAGVPEIKAALPGFQKIPSWTGILGPAGLPKPVLERLHGAFVKALRKPDVEAKLASGANLVGNTPAEFAANIRTGLEQTEKLRKSLGIQLDP